MKKVFYALTVLAVLFCCCACTVTDDNNNSATPDAAPTSTPEPKKNYPADEIELTELKSYTIVYPAGLEDWKMGEIFLLESTIEKVLDCDIDVIPDSVEERKNEIVLGGSKRKTAFDEAASELASGLDYIIAAKDGKLFLGGNDYWSDLRAIYDFINNYLGYDDIENKYSDAKTRISGYYCYEYQIPAITLLACNYSVSAFTEAYAIRDMAEAHFNIAIYEASVYNEAQMQCLLRWSTRYEIRLIFRGFYYIEDMMGCPVIWGHDFYDEPTPDKFMTISRQIDEYEEKYAEYGWKPWVNMLGAEVFWKHTPELTGVFGNTGKFSFDRYVGHSYTKTEYYFHLLESASEYAKLDNSEFWLYIESYNIVNRNQNPSKMFRWTSNAALSFGCKGILYFQYGDASVNYKVEGDWTKGALVNYDFTKNEAWYEAKKTNEELIFWAEKLNECEWLGAYIKDEEKTAIDYSFLEDSYPYFDNVLAEIKDTDEIPDGIVVGCFENKNKKGYCFTVVNISDVDNEAYSETHDEKPFFLKINGENIHFYRGNEEYDIKKNAEGYYELEVANGFSWLVTVE